MEKVCPWCGQPSDQGRLKNRTGSIEHRSGLSEFDTQRRLGKPSLEWWLENETFYLTVDSVNRRITFLINQQHTASASSSSSAAAAAAAAVITLSNVHSLYYNVSEKVALNVVNNFAKSKPIFKILSLLETARNFHHTVCVLLHYLVKCKPFWDTHTRFSS